MSESALICAKTELASLSQNQNILDSDSGFIGLTPVWPIHSSWLGLKVSSLALTSIKTEAQSIPTLLKQLIFKIRLKTKDSEFSKFEN